jgi:hypothetical protein
MGGCIHLWALAGGIELSRTWHQAHNLQLEEQD